MSNFAEYDIERMVITILAAQTDLPAALHRDVDDGADKDRIIVKCDPREVELSAWLIREIGVIIFDRRC